MRRLPWRGNVTVRAGLRHTVGFIFAYFERRRHALSLAAAAAILPWLHDDYLDTGDPRLDTNHGVLRTATSTTATPLSSRLPRQTAQRATSLLEQPRRLPLQPRLHDASTVTTMGGVRRLAFRFFSSLTVCVATVVTVGGC